VKRTWPDESREGARALSHAQRRRDQGCGGENRGQETVRQETSLNTFRLSPCLKIAQRGLLRHQRASVFSSLRRLSGVLAPSARQPVSSDLGRGGAIGHIRSPPSAQRTGPSRVRDAPPSPQGAHNMSGRRSTVARPSRQLRRQPAHPQADRGNLRPGQDDRRTGENQISWTRARRMGLHLRDRRFQSRADFALGVGGIRRASRLWLVRPRLRALSSRLLSTTANRRSLPRQAPLAWPIRPRRHHPGNVTTKRRRECGPMSE
jgi:hypothetical protein